MSSDYDVKAQPFKAWLRSRLKQGKRDTIDALAKTLLADTRIPAKGSKALYLAQLRAKLYPAENIAAFTQAWEEMREKSMTDNKEAQFEAIYGPMPKFSEFKQGERIRYRSGGSTSTGVIAWVCSPQIVAGKQEPTQYVVEPDDRGGFPDVIPQSDIIQ